MPITNIVSPWFTNYGLSQNGHSRVFAFPFSGAGAVIYQSWAKQFEQEDIELLGIQLPGRENRYKEKLQVDLRPLVTQLTSEIIPLLDKPFIFIGHSLGALVAFEVCRELRKHGQPLPLQLFISAFRSPCMANPNPELHNLSDQQLIQRIREYGGTPEAILSSPELMALFIPIIRADFKLFETYQYTEDEPLDCPIATFSASDDSIVKPEYMSNWQKQSTQPVQQKLLSGGHFFLDKNKQTVINQLMKALKN